MAVSLFKKKPDTFDYGLSRICKCCGTTFQGRFCSRCGEKVIEPYERSVWNFLDSLLNAFTSLDGKFFNSLKLLIIRPGKLSRNIADGVRVPFMKMLTFFFMANFFYFFFPVFDSFNSSLYTQMNLLGHSQYATKMVNERLEKEKISLEDFRKKYQAQSTNLSKSLLILLAIMFTLLLMVINYSPKLYFSDHLLFALEYYSFHLLVNLVVIANILLLIIKKSLVAGLDLRFLLTDRIYSLMATTILGYFLFFGQINFYHQKWYWAAVRAAALIFLFGETVALYRRLLFYITMWTL